jgi:hypothetical protein
LTTFIDHRHGTLRPTSEPWVFMRLTGRGETVQTINNGSFAKKVLDDTGPTEKLEHGRGDHALCRGRHRGAIHFVRRPTRLITSNDHWWIVTFEPHVFTCQRASCPATATSRSLVVHRHRFCPPNAGKCALSIRGRLIRVRPTHGHRQLFLSFGFASPTVRQ